MKLIADAGSTKIDWILLDNEGDIAAEFYTVGVNALLASTEEVNSMLMEVKEQLPEGKIDGIYYYGSGCATDRICNRMRELIAEVWDSDEIFVSTDLLGAARSLFGKNKGIVCILGTGSNSCLYDGNTISMNIPSLGYILGDEGSGAALGKRLISDAMKRQLPEKIRTDFLNEYSLTVEELLERVYRQPFPNRFLASLVPFISKNIWNPYLYSIVLKEFQDFFTRNVAMYPGGRYLPIGFVGGIANTFSDILTEAASLQGFKVSTIVKSPARGLAAFHANN